MKPLCFAVERDTFSGPFMPLQEDLLWYFFPPWVGIQTCCSVFWLVEMVCTAAAGWVAAAVP